MESSVEELDGSNQNEDQEMQDESVHSVTRTSSHESRLGEKPIFVSLLDTGYPQPQDEDLAFYDETCFVE